jgi:membrane-associated protein
MYPAVQRVSTQSARNPARKANDHGDCDGKPPCALTAFVDPGRPVPSLVREGRVTNSDLTKFEAPAEAGARYFCMYNGSMFFGIDLATFIQLIGYPGVFAVIFAESGLIIGFFLPGASLLFTAGLLASIGIFNPWILIPLVTIAAILGDNVGYWFGAKIGIKLFTRPDSRFFHQEHLRRAQHFYEEHGWYAIILARFIPIIRTFAPIVAGIASMNYRLFIICNVVGAFLWASGGTSLAYFLGAQFPQVEEYLTPIILGIIFVTTIPLMWQTWKSSRKSV